MATLPIAQSSGPALVDGTLVSEQVPQLYRLVLDLVGELERAGARAEADHCRAAAIEIYSRGWDARGRMRLQRIAETAERRLARPTGRRVLGRR